MAAIVPRRRTVRLDWKLYATITGLTLVSVVLGYPYAASLNGLPYAFADLVRMSLLNGLPSILAVLIGLLCARPLGLDAPLLRAALHGELDSLSDRERLLRRTFVLAPLLGVVLSALMIGMDLLFTSMMLGGGVRDAIAATIAAREAGSPGPLASISAIFYGGIFEEVNMRLFVMSMWAWVVAFIVSRVRREPVRPYRPVMIAAVLVAAIAFGAGHLFTMAGLGELDALTVVRTVTLSAVPGVAFGLLFWRVGLEAAMLAHLATDVGAHVVFPLILGVWS